MSAIPRIPQQAELQPDTIRYIDTLKQAGFAGEIETHYASRLAMATDNSIYQQLPQAVLFPRTEQDVQIAIGVAQAPEFDAIRFSARGGGTGTNGQALTPGVVLDLSRYLNQVLEINVEERWVRVQAGVVKDQLNAALKPYGYFFSPELSTSNRATIGGMINTDASGQGSLRYGKTSDHVLGLTSVMADGAVLESTPLPLADAQQKAKQEGMEGQIYQQVIATCVDKAQAIRDAFPDLNRFLTGYDLVHAWDGEQVDLSRLICGSEGSLAVVTQAKLNLTPIPRLRTLVNVKYESFNAALRNAPFLVKANALSVETVDSKVLGLAQQDVVWHSVSELITPVVGKSLDGLNIVEFADDDAQQHQQKITALCERLDQLIDAGEAGVIGYQTTSELDDVQKIYGMRKKSVGLLGNAKGNKKPIPFTEDTCVPPEHLADFIMEFRALLDAHQLQYGMFGHVDSGVLHVRPAMDLCDPGQEKLLRKISDQVVELTAKYHGLMWGEHGKGYRSEYGPAFFGEAMFTELQKIKTAFDPENRMNPGKICTPLSSSDVLVSVDATKRGFYDRQIPVAVRQSFAETINCNGNGLCFNFDVNSTMCPSMKVTADRRHSPKGRAGLMREWLRLTAAMEVDVEQVERTATGVSLSRFTQRIRNSWRKYRGEYDFSHEVMDSMKGCLACKACTTACPIGVDVPLFRSRFMQLYHTRYLRPIRDYLVGGLEVYLPLMARAPRFMNLASGNPISRWLVAKTTGFVDAPLVSYPTLKQSLAGHCALGWELEALAALSEEQKRDFVLLVQDPFTSFYDAEVVRDFVHLIAALGKKPVLLPFVPNGKAEHVKGFLSRFSRTAENGAAFLNQLAELGIPMVGVDPSTVLCYRDEYNKVLGDKRGDFHVMMLQEWLLGLPELMPDLADSGQTFELYAHCTEKSALPTTHADWTAIFARFGLSLTPKSVGCCGMAGTYGHEIQNQQHSKQLYELSWQKPIQQAGIDNVLVTGYSCRSQVKRREGQKPKHPVQVLLKQLTEQQHG